MDDRVKCVPSMEANATSLPSLPSLASCAPSLPSHALSHTYSHSQTHSPCASPPMHHYVPPPPGFRNGHHSRHTQHTVKSESHESKSGVYGNSTTFDATLKKPIPPAKPPRKSLLPANRRVTCCDFDHSITTLQTADNNEHLNCDICPKHAKNDDHQHLQRYSTFKDDFRRHPIEESDFSVLYDQIANESTLNACSSLNRPHIRRAHLSSHTRSKSEHHPKFYSENLSNAILSSDNSNLVTKTKRATVQIPIINDNDVKNNKFNEQTTPDYEPPSPGTAESGIRAVILPLNLKQIKDSNVAEKCSDFHSYRQLNCCDKHNDCNDSYNYINYTNRYNQYNQYNQCNDECESSVLDSTLITHLEYQRVCAKSSRDIETLTEEELFATVDASGYVWLSFHKSSNEDNHQINKKSVSVSTDNDLIRSPLNYNKHHNSVDNRNYHNYCETLKLDRTGEKNNPFAGLCRGSNIKKREVTDGRRSLRRQRNISCDTNYCTIRRNKTKKSKSMDTNTVLNSKERSTAKTILMHNYNGSIDSIENKTTDISVLSGSPFDENAEWAEIANIMASFGSDIACDFNTNKGDDQTVEDWLSTIGVSEYANLLIVNGFDNIVYMGSNVMDDSDLLEIGVTNAFDREKILKEAKSLPKVKLLAQTDTITVVDWLNSLKLNQYLKSFVANGYDDVLRIRNLWEVELNTVLEINKLGHRKRILASLRDRHKLIDDLVFDDFDFDQLNLNISELKVEEPLNCSKTVISCSSDSVVPNNESVTQLIPKSITNLQSNVCATNKVMPSLPLTTPHSMCEQWRHTNSQLINESCKYNAQYLGSTLVKELNSMDSAKASIEKLKQSTKHILKIPNIILSISYTGVKFIDAQTNQLVCEHEIRNIHCICQDNQDLNHLAYITKETETNNHYCHVFSAQNMDISTEIILTLGQAFEIAYQMELESSGKQIVQNTNDSSKVMTPKSSKNNIKCDNNNTGSSIANKIIDTQTVCDTEKRAYESTNNDNNKENISGTHITAINISVNSDEQYSTIIDNEVYYKNDHKSANSTPIDNEVQIKCCSPQSSQSSQSPHVPVRTTSVAKPVLSNKPSIASPVVSKIASSRPIPSPKPTTIPKPVTRTKPIPPFKPKILAKPNTTK